MKNASSFSTLFLRNRHLLGLAIVVSLAAGLFGVARMQRLEDPRITNLFPIVITSFPGASAERVETLVTEPLEDELSSRAPPGASRPASGPRSSTTSATPQPSP